MGYTISVSYTHLHRGLPEARRANTAAKDAAVCPEGKDASAGGAVSSSTAVFTKKGRICDHGEIWILLAAVLLLLWKHRWTGMSLSFALILDLICCNIVV